MTSLSPDGLHAHNVDKWYGSSCALRDVSLRIVPGSITAIVGPSGSGKSTLLRILSGLEPPDAGHVTIDGRPMTEATKSPQKPGYPWPYVSVVFQHYFLWPHLTLRRNIELPLRSARIAAREISSRIAELESLLGLGQFLDRFANEVSGGEKQRAALARALALRPQYLLLDEITSSLDEELAARVFEHLRTLRESNVGISIVSHSPRVRGIADGVLILRNCTSSDSRQSSVVTSNDD